MNPDDLRSGLATAFPDVPPPPDLAARAERKAAAIRRRRYALTAAAMVALVAVPVMAVELRGDRALTPAAVPAGDPCRPPAALPGQPLGTSADDAAAWGYRGDPALRDTATRVARLHNDAVGIPLYAARTGPQNWLLVVYAARVTTDWNVFAVWAPKGVQASNVYVQDAAIGKLPRLRPDAAISLLLRTPRPQPPSSYDATYATNLLVALAPPGSTGLTFRGCRSGDTFEERVAGDVLVRDVGTLDAPGRLAVRTATGDTGYDGPVADLPWQPGLRADVQLPPVEAIPVPPGFRKVFRAAGQGGVEQSEGASVDGAVVFVRCRASGGMEVYVGRKLVGRAKCDGTVELVGENVDLDGRASLGPLDEPPPPVAYQVLVVVTG